MFDGIECANGYILVGVYPNKSNLGGLYRLNMKDIADYQNRFGYNFWNSVAWIPENDAMGTNHFVHIQS
jgi:hypothetical protein